MYADALGMLLSISTLTKGGFAAALTHESVEPLGEKMATL